MCDFTIHQIRKSQFHTLIPLWTTCFPDDSSDYVANFMSSLPDDSVALVGRVGDSIVTMLTLLPARVTFRNKTLPVRYLYAGCTHPQHRGKGYYRQLMSAAESSVRDMSEFAIYLHPADETLVNTYSRMGYQTGICGSKKAMHNPQLSADYKQKRYELLEMLSKDTVVWDLCNSIVDYFIDDALKNGAFASITDTTATLAIGSMVIEHLAIQGTNETNTYCLWLPTQESPLSEWMTSYNGYTGLIGD